MSSNPYTLNQALLNEGHYFDLTGAYFHYNETFQSIGVEDTTNFKTRDDLYLWISRNPDKKLELKCKWAIKTPEGFIKKKLFTLDFTLDIGDEKTLKLLNKKIAFAGERNNNPSSDGSYIEFVDYITNIISENECLEVFKEDVFDFPEIASDEDLQQDELDEKLQSFNDYPEDIQHQALELVKEGKVFDEIQESVSLTHEGHKTTRNALILMESSLFVGDGAHGLLGGASGMGKSDLAFAIAYNFPEKHVHILRNISPKNIYYDFESYDEDFNILILDDIPFNEDLINLCKELTDNTKKVKELKTVINGKQRTFRLKGKYEVIITYAKTLPDEELANRLFNIGVSIVDEDESEVYIKEKIRDNGVTNGNENLIIERKRLIIQACIQYLLEQKMKVYNPFLSIFNPINYNNRDINHLINMTKARTFFEYAQRKQIKVNDEVSLTIGSYEDLNFVHDIWARDEKAQLYKLSERQKQILDILPEMTSKEAFDKVDEINEELKNAQSRAFKQAIKDKEPFAKSIARELQCNVSTLKHDLDRVSEGTHKSLLEIGLVEKIRLDEDNVKSPNFYYKIKDEGNVFNLDENKDKNSNIIFSHSLNSSIVKQKIILDLLIYANIVVNEKGICYVKNFCENYEQEIDVENYKQLIAFLQSFFDGLNYDEDTIKLNVSSLQDINAMMTYNDEITKSLQKRETHTHDPEETKICALKENDESSSNDETSNISHANHENTSLHNKSFQYREQFEEKHIDVELAYNICKILSSGEKNLDQVRNKLCEFEDPDNVYGESLPLKIEMTLKRLVDNSYLITIENFNQARQYKLNNELKDFFEGENS